MFWPAAKLVVEVDGYHAHGHRAAFERDRRKQAELVAAGYRVIRITWRQLTEQPLVVAAVVAPRARRLTEPAPADRPGGDETAECPHAEATYQKNFLTAR